jgi:hypothetical protein
VPETLRAINSAMAAATISKVRIARTTLRLQKDAGKIGSYVEQDGHEQAAASSQIQPREQYTPAYAESKKQ